MPCDLQDNALTTPNRVKLELGIDESDTSKDTMICELINAYSDSIETLTGRSFKLQNYSEKYPGTGNQLLFPKNYPITDISSIMVGDYVLESTEYEVKGRLLDRVFKNNGWPKSNYTTGMSRYPVFTDNNISIDYSAGYVLPNDANPPDRPRTLPYDLEKVILNLISMDQAQEGTSKGLKSFSISDVKWDFLNEVRPQDAMTLKKYGSSWI